LLHGFAGATFYLESFPVPEHFERTWLANFFASHSLRSLLRRAYAVAINGCDNVSRFQFHFAAGPLGKPL